MGTEHFFAEPQGYLDFIQGYPGKVPKRPGRSYLFAKRIFDIVGATAGLALILPLFPFVVLLIKLESSGPIFFRQIRVGQYGRLFECYKFRSMVPDAETCKNEILHLNEATGAAFKIKNDPRITGVGRFLRRSSLDEFPQLFNVLKGEMTIIGPRPQIPQEVQEYSPTDALRLLVKPGLTCLWQIAGRSNLDFQEWMGLDRDYVLGQGFRMDLHVMWRTLPAVIQRRGAY